MIKKNILVMAIFDTKGDTVKLRYGSIGHVFQKRYKAILIQKESHLLEVCRYVMYSCCQ